MNENSNCYKICNQNFTQLDPRRIYCKKGCGSDNELNECLKDTCENLCVKKELGEDGNSWGSKYLHL